MKKIVIKSLSLLFALVFVFSIQPLNTMSVRAVNNYQIDTENPVLYDNDIATASVVTNSFDVTGSSMGRYYSNFSDNIIYTDRRTNLRFETNVHGELVSVSDPCYDTLQHRSNCYGYAFKMFYSPEEFPEGQEFYKQSVGEFANKENYLEIEYDTDCFVYISNKADLKNFYRRTYYFSDNRMYMLEQLLRADAASLGYTLTEYTGTTIPDATTYTDRRLIAVVAGNMDYHFYMQHSDNTWSHKQGANVPSNKCIDCEIELTNNNIRTHACEDVYNPGILKFFYITKDAVIDYRHLDGSYDSSTYTVVNPYDMAGNYIFAAKDIGTLPEDYELGNIDYQHDVDYYKFRAESTQTRNIYVSISNGHSLTASIYDSSGSLLAQATTTTSTSLTVNLVASQTYYISFTSDLRTYEYNRCVYEFS